MATITTTTYLDSLTVTAGESMTINGGTLIVRTDTRVHPGAPSGMTGSLGSVTCSSTLGGGYYLDGTNVRVIAFTGASGNVPAIGTTITGGTSGTTGYLLGVWADWASAPTTPGSATPTTGYLKFREVSVKGGFINGETLSGGGWSATANGSDKVGWIEVVHDQAANLTFVRLGLGFKVSGDWFELGVGNGTPGQTFQVPTNGGGSGTHVPGVYVETGNGTNVFEWWPALSTETGWSSTYIGTDARAKIVQNVGNGQIRFGSDGTNNVGLPCPNGARVRIPNVIGRQCETTSRNQNATPHTTMGTRPEMVTTSAPVIDIEYFISDWYMNLSAPYSVNISNSCFEGILTVTNSPSSVNISDVCVSKTVAVAQYAFNCQTNVNGGNINKLTLVRYDAASSGYTAYFNNVAGTKTNPFEISNIKVYAGIGAARNSTGYAIYMNNCAWVNISYIYQFNHGTYINVCSNISVSKLDHCDRVIGTTNTTTGVYCIYISYSKDVTVSRITFGLGGTISDVHPYNGIFYTVNNLGGIKLRNAGTFASKLPGGSANQPAYIWNSGGNEVDITVQRCYLTATRTLPFTAPNTVKGCKIEHVYGTLSQAQTMMALDTIVRNIGSSNTTTGQTSVYGTHWLDCFTGTTTGRVILAFNEPTDESRTSHNIYTNFGSGAGYTSTGSCVMPNVGDQIIIETPWFIKGHTGFQNTTPTITGTNTSNFTYEYQIDTGSGWNGTWKTLNGTNLSGETVNPSIGFKLKYRITTVTANSNNVLTYIRIDTTTTSTAQQDNLYPLEVVEASLTITGIADGTRVKVFNNDYSEILDDTTLSGTTEYTYNYEWNSDTDDFNVNVLLWKNDKIILLLKNVLLTKTSQRIPITQSDDLVYGTASTNATIDFTNKLIIMNSGATEYDVQGIYSLWKNKVADSTNAKYDFAFSVIGGNQISGSNFIPYYTYLTNGWRVRPDEADHTLEVVNGILLVDGGGDPFVDTLGDYTVRINYKQPVQAIAVSTSGGGGATAAEIWNYSSRTLTGSVTVSSSSEDSIAQKVWANSTRGLTEEVTVDSASQEGIAQAVWDTQIEVRDQGSFGDAIINIQADSKRSLKKSEFIALQ